MNNYYCSSSSLYCLPTTGCAIMGRLEDERTMMWPRYLKYGFVKGCVNNKPAQCGVRKRIFLPFFYAPRFFF